MAASIRPWPSPSPPPPNRPPRTRSRSAASPPARRRSSWGRRLLLVVSLVLLAPTFADLSPTWERLRDGSHGWLALALAVRGALLRRPRDPLRRRRRARRPRAAIGLRAALQINLAANAATRLFASAGAGGIALTAWAMRRSGMERADVAARMVAFHVLLYGVYMGVLLLGGLGLYAGVLPGGGSFAITVVPAILGGRGDRRWSRPPSSSRPARAASAGRRPGRPRRARRPRPAAHRQPGLLGALMWWGFDIAVLWAASRPSAHAPSVAVLAVAFFVGMLANPLPLPGRRRRRRRRHGRRADRLRRRARAGAAGRARLPRLRVLAADRPGRDRVPQRCAARSPAGSARTPASPRYPLVHGRLRWFLQRPGSPEAPSGDGRADAGCPEPRLGRQRHQARRRHDGGGDRPHQRPGHAPSSRPSRSVR